MICSLYKIDFEPIEGDNLPLVNLMDNLLAEPSFTGVQEVETAPLLRADHVAVFPRGNVAREVTFSRVYDFADIYLARQFVLDHMVILDVLGKGKLRVEVKNSSPRWIEGCALVGEPEESDELLPTQVAFSYTVMGGKIANS